MTEPAPARAPRKDLLRFIVGFLTLSALLLHAVTFLVHEGEAAVVTRLGDPVRVETKAGLHFKMPWPVAKAIVIDTRARFLTAPQTELLTRDKKNIVLTAGSTWQVVEPVQYYRSVKTVQGAEDKLQSLVVNANISTFGQYDLDALVSTDPTSLSIETIERDVLRLANAVAVPRYGVKLLALGFHRVSLPAQNVPYVLEQMRSERQKFAAQFRAEGALEAARIRNAADLDAARLIADATEKATRIIGTAEAEAASIYANAHATAPEFYAFVRSLESIEAVVGDNARLTLRTDVAPFNLLKSAPDSTTGEGVSKQAPRHKLSTLLGDHK